MGPRREPAVTRPLPPPQGTLAGFHGGWKGARVPPHPPQKGICFQHFATLLPRVLFSAASSHSASPLVLPWIYLLLHTGAPGDYKGRVSFPPFFGGRVGNSIRPQGAPAVPS